MALLAICGGGLNPALTIDTNVYTSMALTQLYFQSASGEYPGTSLVFAYINDLFLSIHHSTALSFADDTKLFKLIKELADSLKLQEDLSL